MKGLSLIQPWASAVTLGAKSIETRSWSTNYRGWVAIHASKGMPLWAKEFTLTEAYRYLMHEPEWFPRGAILGAAVLSGVARTEDVEIDERERFFGDYSAGRFAWKLENVRVLPAPIPCAGALGLWTVPADLVAAI